MSIHADIKFIEETTGFKFKQTSYTFELSQFATGYVNKHSKILSVEELLKKTVGDINKRFQKIDSVFVMRCYNNHLILSISAQDFFDDIDGIIGVLQPVLRAKSFLNFVDSFLSTPDMKAKIKQLEESAIGKQARAEQRAEAEHVELEQQRIQAEIERKEALKNGPLYRLSLALTNSRKKRIILGIVAVGISIATNIVPRINF